VHALALRAEEDQHLGCPGTGAAEPVRGDQPGPRRAGRQARTDPSLYHLVIDSTAVPLDIVIELILVAARAHHTATESVTARS